MIIKLCIFVLNIKRKLMKKITLLLSLVLIAFVSVSQQTINLNTSASSIKWIGSKVKSQHEGNIDFSKGHLIINDGKKRKDSK